MQPELATARPPAPVFMSLLQGHDLVVVPSSQTLVFEHTYTFWVRPRLR